MTDKKTCSRCEIEKPIEDFKIYFTKFNPFPREYLRYNYCKDCEFKNRCHTCKKVMDLERFYVSKSGRINNFKCKTCYKDEYKSYLF
jgi:hypothetical protein